MAYEPESLFCEGPGCGVPLTYAGRGRKPKFCSEKCNKRAQRLRRRRPVLEALPYVEPDDPASVIAEWARVKLRVPPGHRLAGEPMALPPFAVDFLRDAFASREALLCVARKNAKTAILMVVLLALLVGPMAQPGRRYAIASVSKEKAGEGKRQLQEIAEASGLEGLRFFRSPAPGRVEARGGTLDILSADKSAGHSAGWDIVLCDELGLVPERKREYVAGLRSSTSARDGKFWALSIQGDSPFTKELIERRAEPNIAVHLYRPPADCRIDDEAAWHAGNPALALGIKSLEYMRHESRRVLSTPADQGSFRAYDLNLPQDPARVLIVPPDDWARCTIAAAVRDALPPRDGWATLGWDLGSSSSLTCAVAWWPRTGRLEAWGAFPGLPDLRARGRGDGVGDLYVQMEARGEIWTYPNCRVTPVNEFLEHVARELADVPILAAGADRFRRAEATQALEAVGVEFPVVWRGQGASASADGSHDVRAFVKAVKSRRIVMVENLAMAHAIRESAIRTDGAGNPALDKARANGRIDMLSAAVIAVGLGSLGKDDDTGGGWFA
ncbi:MAG: terminase large subunit [Gammaproteobacteria bacterium]|nr:terminase large subunit [Gammaproteobacteria bacterium]